MCDAHDSKAFSIQKCFYLGVSDGGEVSVGGLLRLPESSNLWSLEHLSSTMLRREGDYSHLPISKFTPNSREWPAKRQMQSHRCLSSCSPERLTHHLSAQQSTYQAGWLAGSQAKPRASKYLCNSARSPPLQKKGDGDPEISRQLSRRGERPSGETGIAESRRDETRVLLRASVWTVGKSKQSPYDSKHRGGVGT